MANFKFKTRHVSIVHQSSSVVNSFVSSVELIQAMTYKLKCDTNQNFKKLTYNFKMCETWNNTCASTTLTVSAPANFQHYILPSNSFYSKFRWCNMHIWCSFLNIPSLLRKNLLRSWLIYWKLKKNFYFRY